MKRIALITGLAAVMLLASVSQGFAASEAGYSFVLPRLKGDVYSSTKAVSAYRDFGVKHKYSGGYPVAMTVCSSGKSPIGPRVVVYPGGVDAPLVDLWYNASPTVRNVMVRLESANYNIVTILAQGTWRWNY